jgi:predicted flavoprotein YhiN
MLSLCYHGDGGCGKGNGSDGEQGCEFRLSVIFTSAGLSGPSVLEISRKYIWPIPS